MQTMIIQGGVNQMPEFWKAIRKSKTIPTEFLLSYLNQYTMPFAWSLLNDGIRKMVAIYSDALLKAISEVFGCSSAHLKGYCSDFLLNSHLQFFQIMWSTSEHFLLQISPQEEVANAQIRWAWGPLDVTPPRDEACRKHLLQFDHYNLSSVGCCSILLELDVSQIFFLP